MQLSLCESLWQNVLWETPVAAGTPTIVVELLNVNNLIYAVVLHTHCFYRGVGFPDMAI